MCVYNSESNPNKQCDREGVCVCVRLQLTEPLCAGFVCVVAAAVRDLQDICSLWPFQDPLRGMQFETW